MDEGVILNDQIVTNNNSKNISNSSCEKLRSLSSRWQIKLFVSRSKIKSQHIHAFAGELMTLLKAGIPLVNALSIMAATSVPREYRDLIIQIKMILENGAPLSKALAVFPRYFDKLFVNLVYVGEQSGTLDVMLQKLVMAHTKLRLQKRQMQKAIFYPLLILLVAMVVSGLLLFFVIPRFQELWTSFGSELPAYTQLVISVARFLQKTFIYIIVFLVGIICLFKYGYKKSATLRFKWQKFFITKVPLVSKLVRQALTARLARILAITLGAGLPLTSALRLSVQVLNNSFYQFKLGIVRQDIEMGTMLSLALQNSNLFSQRVISLVTIGEKSGNLDGALNQVADYYDDKLNALIVNLNIFVEPVLMLVLGFVVGAIIIAIYLPIFQLGSVVR